MFADNIEQILIHIAKEHGYTFKSSQPLAGGDINDVYKVTCEEKNLVLKINDASRFPGMFDAEFKGLELLKSVEAFAVPQPLHSGIFEGSSYLILEYYETGKKAFGFWEDFGKTLADLHLNTKSQFGLDHDNYIGSLPQYNSEKSSASEFYIEQRIEPQVKMAKDNGFSLQTATFYKNCENLIPDEKPALVHGDLWGGNYMSLSNGKPALIDPAVAYAPREMDLAMMKLFGGFDASVFEVYKDHFPVEPGFDERIQLWQLYYLLVHLNIFGAAYLSRCTSIISRYT